MKLKKAERKAAKNIKQLLQKKYSKNKINLNLTYDKIINPKLEKEKENVK